MIQLEVNEIDVEAQRKVTFNHQSRDWSMEPMFNQAFLKSVEMFANDTLFTRGHVLVNDVLDMLGLPRTRIGMITGWVLGSQIDFGMDVTTEHSAVFLTLNFDGVIYDRIIMP